MNKCRGQVGVQRHKCLKKDTELLLACWALGRGLASLTGTKLASPHLKNLAYLKTSYNGNQKGPTPELELEQMLLRLSSIHKALGLVVSTHIHIHKSANSFPNAGQGQAEGPPGLRSPTECAGIVGAATGPRSGK